MKVAKAKKAMWAGWAVLLTIVLLATGCSSARDSNRAESKQNGLSTSASQTMLLNGAGATFPYPLYSKWFDEYQKVDKTVRVNYQSIGSGGGIRAIIEGTVDFGASDAPMSDEELARAPGELLHIPTVAGAVVVTYNLKNVEKGLRLTPEVLVDILLGKITKWNDSRIKSLNPDVSLPDQVITVVARSDGSGTTNIFTDYLSSVSLEWSEKVGKGKQVKWPVGVTGKGNEGVAALVKQTPGALGYVELAYAIQNKMPYAFIQNQAGKFVEPTLRTITAAMASAAAKMPHDMRVSIVNPPGDESYPIAGYTYIIIYKDQKDRARGEKLVNLLWWAIHDGQQYAGELLYAALPPEVVSKVEAKLRQVNHRGAPLLSR